MAETDDAGEYEGWRLRQLVASDQQFVDDAAYIHLKIEALHERYTVPRASLPSSRAHADFLQKIKPYVQAWYGTWHETMLNQPFYRVNSRV